MLWQNDEINFPFTLAPMVGLSHGPFRHLLSEYLPAGAKTIWPTEMLNSRKLFLEKVGQTPETQFRKGEENLVPQILGNEEDAICKSVQVLTQFPFIKGVDINMGCPVAKALKHNYGVALMGDIDYAARVVSYAVSASSLPVAVKLRAVSLNGNAAAASPATPFVKCAKDFDFLLTFVRALVAAGASWITLHPRASEEKRRGSADWEQVRLLKEKIAVPIIGNGDVQTAEEALMRLKTSRCDLVMMGRSLTARPWLFWQLGRALGMPDPVGRLAGELPLSATEEGAEYGRCLLRLLNLMEYYAWPPNLVLRRMQFFIKTGSVWLAFGHQLYAESTRAKSPDELRWRLQKFFAIPLKMMRVTELRA